MGTESAATPGVLVCFKCDGPIRLGEWMVVLATRTLRRNGAGEFEIEHAVSTEQVCAACASVERVTALRAPEPADTCARCGRGPDGLDTWIHKVESVDLLNRRGDIFGVAERRLESLCPRCGGPDVAMPRSKRGKRGATEVAMPGSKQGKRSATEVAMPGMPGSKRGKRGATRRRTPTKGSAAGEARVLSRAGRPSSILVFQLPSSANVRDVVSKVLAVTSHATQVGVAGPCDIYLGTECRHVMGLSTWLGIEGRLPAAITGSIRESLVGVWPNLGMEYADVARHGLRRVAHVDADALDVIGDAVQAPFVLAAQVARSLPGTRTWFWLAETGVLIGVCSLCMVVFDGVGDRASMDTALTYPCLVCRGCEKRARTVEGAEPEHNSLYDDGSNPIVIDGKQCWRRYKFGGFVTMLDPWRHQSLDAFYDLIFDR